MEDQRSNYCIYCHEPVTDDQAYSVRKMGDHLYWWHYLCYVDHAVELVPLTIEEQKFLIRLVISAYPDPDGIALTSLRGLGYGI